MNAEQKDPERRPRLLMPVVRPDGRDNGGGPLQPTQTWKGDGPQGVRSIRRIPVLLLPLGARSRQVSQQRGSPNDVAIGVRKDSTAVDRDGVT